MFLGLRLSDRPPLVGKVLIHSDDDYINSTKMIIWITLNGRVCLVDQTCPLTTHIWISIYGTYYLKAVVLILIPAEKILYLRGTNSPSISIVVTLKPRE